jgi:ATP-dependent exoDNAse (exonuclease V) beta subunit
MLQVDYVNLVAAPASIDGAVWRLPITPGSGKQPVDARLSDEARQLAAFLAEHGPASVGAATGGDICIVAPRKDWLDLVRDQLSVAKVKTALQMRRNRNGDNPVYAWVCGILAVVCDPDNTFEWVGVLRELFSISDAVIAGALAGRGFRWQEPGDYPRPIADAVGVLTPLIDLADVEEGSLVDFALRLSAACGLREKARAADPDGGLEDELTRILAGACEIAMTGGGPRAWLRSLLGAIDEYRPSGRPSSDAINLTTSHSAKGLEWPVVIPVGLGRPIMTKREGGLRIVAERGGGSRVAYDPASVPAEARDSLERARLRELVRLLYVTLTRPKTTLVIPWSGAKAEKNSFAEIWAFDAGSLPAVPEGDPAPEPVPAGAGAGLPEAENGAPPVPASVRPFPRRILPHGLAAAPDPARAALHESSVDLPQVVKAAPDPLEYGIWWHETLEFMPWDGDVAAIEAHGNASLARAAQQGFAERAGEEWTRLLGSDSLRTIREARWTRLAEAGIFAPLAPDGWIDGVIDLVLHDAGAREVWIIDWKTNRRGAGEDDPALLGRLCAEYRGQLSAYGACASGFFPGCRVRLWVYSSVAGTWSATEGLS